jgi:glyoxylase-like metal-dependent hydrolase (beta-lactamase superfamily II)
VRDLTAPTARVYRYSEVVAGDGGFVNGIDTSSRMKQSIDSNPPRHAMSGTRLAVALRELQRASPQLLIEMRADPAKLKLMPDQFAGGKRLTAVQYRAEADTFIVLFDQASGLPERIRTLDTDSAWGDCNFDLVLSDWREVGGAKFPFHQLYFLDGRLIVHSTYDEVTLDPTLSAALFEVPATLRASLQPPAVHDVEYQWMLRRILWGGFYDSDQLAFDPQAGGLKLVELAPGVSHLTGGSHNSLVVEMKDHLIVFDAPISNIESRVAMNAAKAKYPGKPVRYLVQTHHHIDHISGAREYAAAGVKVVAGAPNVGYLRHMFGAPHKVRKDALALKPRKTDIIAVNDKQVLTDGTRKVEVYRIENTHADGMLMGYIPDAKLGWIVDIWSPGRDPIVPTAGQREVYQAVSKLGITPERFAGGHGSVGAYSELAAKAGGAK